MGEWAGTLISVNVGLPRDVAWRGQMVHTGVWKHPVDGRRRVRRDNVDGDGQATSPDTVASSARSSSTSWTPTGTGASSWAATT